MLIKEKKILIDNIKITFFASNRSKSIRISINQNKGVRVSVPLFVSFKSAKIFTQSKINWIKKNISKMENMKSSMTVFRNGSEFKTKFKLIKVKCIKPLCLVHKPIASIFISKFYLEVLWNITVFLPVDRIRRFPKVSLD